MARRDRFSMFALALGVFVSFLCCGDAMAQVDLHDASGSFTGLLDLVQSSAAQWDARLRDYATRLFWSLALIQFIWTFFPLVFRQADFGEIVGELIRFILVIGFFAALLLYSREWAEAIINSFRQAGASAAGLSDTALRPGDIFGRAVELAKTVGEAKTWNPLAGVAIALAAAVVLLCFAFIAAFMGLTIIESYLVINASVLFMGLGAAQWTREYAMAIIRYAISVGAKLFVLTLLVGIIMESTRKWQAAYNHDDASMWTMVGLALACAYLAKTIPDLIQGIITGSSPGGGSAIGSMAAAAAAGAAAAASAMATAGAAAAGAIGAGATGGSGLSSSINSSFAGQTGASPPGGAAGKGGTASTSSATGASNAAKAVTPRISGGDAAGGAGGPAPKLGDAASSMKQAADQGQQQSDGQGLGRTLVSGMVRGAGILSAISVPGMESAAGLSLGAAPPPPMTGEGGGSAPSMEGEGAENIIRPVETPDEPPTSPTAAPTAPQEASTPPEAPKDEPPTSPTAAPTAPQEASSPPEAPKGGDKP